MPRLCMKNLPPNGFHGNCATESSTISATVFRKRLALPTECYQLHSWNFYRFFMQATIYYCEAGQKILLGDGMAALIQK
jgi:hypothetical protein